MGGNEALERDREACKGGRLSKGRMSRRRSTDGGMRRRYMAGHRRATGGREGKQD